MEKVVANGLVRLSSGPSAALMSALVKRAGKRRIWAMGLLNVPYG